MSFLQLVPEECWWISESQGKARPTLPARGETDGQRWPGIGRGSAASPRVSAARRSVPVPRRRRAGGERVPTVQSSEKFPVWDGN